MRYQIVTWIHWAGAQMFGPKIEMSHWMVLQRLKRNVIISRRKTKIIWSPRENSASRRRERPQVPDTAKKLYEKEADKYLLD